MTKTTTALALAAALALPVAAGAATPGEETVLSVSYLGLPTGEGRIVVGRPAGDILPVIFQAKTSGIAGMLDIRENLVVYWDADAKLTRGSDLKAIELGDYHQDVTRFDRGAGQVTFTVQRKGQVREKRAACPADGHDLTGAFLFIRTQPLAPGQRFEVPVCSSAEPFTLVAEVQARETVRTPAGTFTALKVSVRTGLSGKFKTKRDTTLWFSDDPRHVLVQMSADFAVGSVVATLKSYTPGQAVASAPSGGSAAQ